MSVVMHPTFVKATKIISSFIYLDEEDNQWAIPHGDKKYAVKNTNMGKWKEIVWKVEGTEPLNGFEANKLVEQGMIAGKNKKQIAALIPDITITALKGNPVFHMVEVFR